MDNMGLHYTNKTSVRYLNIVVAVLSAIHLFAFVLKEDFHYYFHNITFFCKHGQKSVQAMLVIMKVA